jgi:hypothetical protein
MKLNQNEPKSKRNLETAKINISFFYFRMPQEDPWPSSCSVPLLLPHYFIIIPVIRLRANFLSYKFDPALLFLAYQFRRLTNLLTILSFRYYPDSISIFRQASQLGL